MPINKSRGKEETMSDQINKFLGLTTSNAKNTFANINYKVKEGLKNLSENGFEIDAKSGTYDLSPLEIKADLRRAQGQIYALGQVMREGQTSFHLNMKM